ncbi:DnaB-like helicase C-terminal domain-containing protein [Vibrio owensii]|uniref:DnaB-like helicase C-terminal domain-containing protein n=1 Tax=Vibrio owensii TaxID=696485 RepID=UPI003394CE2C
MEREPDAIAAIRANIAAKGISKPKPVATEESLAKDLGTMMMGKTKSVPAPVVNPEPEDKPFEFSEDFQTKIAALMIRDENFMRRIDGMVKPHHFERFSEAQIVGLAIRHFDNYGQLPTSEPSVWAEIIKDAQEQRIISSDECREVVKDLRRILTSSLSNREFVLEKVADFAKKQEIMKAIHSAIDMAERGDFDSIESRFNRAFNIGMTRSYEEINYWDHIDERTEVRKEKASGLIKPTGIPTGVKKIDSLLYHKGLGRKELTAIMGGAKKGKSMGLGDIGARISLQGYNVLYATLEVAGTIIADRLDANITKTSMGDLESSMHKIRDEVLDKASHAGEFRICEFPSGTLTCKELRRVIERYRSEGIKFDLIITDYADIMAPDFMTQSETENSKQIWLGLRAIAQIEDCAMLTATQTNRTGFKNTTAKAEDVAEDFNKIRIADLVISINRTDEERDKGEARLYFAASRNQAGEFSIRIRQSLDRMSFIDGVLDIC